MKGKIKPEEKYTKVKNITEAQTLELDIENDIDKNLYVLTEITKALIATGNYNPEKPKTIVGIAEKVAKEILGR